MRLPYAGDIESLAVDLRRPGIVFGLGGWTRFGALYAFDPAAGRVRDTGLQPQGRFDNPLHLVATEVKVHGGRMARRSRCRSSIARG